MTGQGRATGIRIAIVTAVVGAVLLTGCDGSGTPTGGDESPTLEVDASKGVRPQRGVTAQQRVTYFGLKVGYCFQLPKPTDTLVTAVPCDERHTAEVFATFDLPGEGSYPAEATVRKRAETRCGTEFDEYVGAGPSDGTLVYYSYYPTQEMWEYGDYDVVCALAYDDKRVMTGSLEGGFA